MYPTLHTTRPRLPSVLSVFGPIEQYQAEQDKRAPFRGAAAIIEPLDAYLAHLLVNVYPGEPVLLDLAAEATAGASTLLGLLHPRQPRVYAVAGPLPGDRRAYRGMVEEFVQRQGKELTPLHWLSRAESAADLHGETDVFIFVAASEPDVDAKAEQWLNFLPSAIVLVFGLGAVGDCAVLDALVHRFPTGSPRRLTLLRESGEVLSASRLGIVAEHSNAAAELTLRRFQQLFTGNYSFLGLLRSVTEQALGASQSDTFLEWNDEINQLKKAAAEELHALKSSLSYRLSERLLRWRQQLAPDGTWRHRLFQVLRRIAQIVRREGCFSLLRRLVRRCFRRKVADAYLPKREAA
jgi:hypothetical protein